MAAWAELPSLVVEKIIRFAVFAREKSQGGELLGLASPRLREGVSGHFYQLLDLLTGLKKTP